MANVKVRLKDASNNILHPETDWSVVQNKPSFTPYSCAENNTMLFEFYKETGIRNYGGNSIAIPFTGCTNLALGGSLTIKLADVSSVGAISFYGLKVIIASQSTMGNLDATIKIATDPNCTLWTVLRGDVKIDFPLFDKTCFTPWLVVRSSLGNFANSFPKIVDVSWDSSPVPSSPTQWLIPGLALINLFQLTDISSSITSAKTPLLNLFSRIDSIYLLADDYTNIRDEVVNGGAWRSLVPRRCWIRYAAAIADPMAIVDDTTKMNFLVENPDSTNFLILSARDVENQMFYLNARLTTEEMRVMFRTLRNM